MFVYENGANSREENKRMTVERVTSGLNLQSGDRFIVLYGANTSDTFCSQDLLLRNIEQVLHKYLRCEGYQRILFYSGIQKLYFLDEKSRDRSRLQPQSVANSASSEPMRFGGALGNKRGLLGKKSAQTNTPATPPLTAPHSNRRLQDAAILPFFETAMQDSSQKSAIVFSNAEDLGNFDNRRELFGRIVDWSRLPPNNRNLCIFIFHHENRTTLQDFCQRIEFTFLANLANNGNDSNSSAVNFVRLNGPNAIEIGALRDYFRLEHRKVVDWNGADKLCSWIAGENKPLNYWYDRFETARQISLTEARRLGWLSADMNAKPALERLAEMTGLAAVKDAIRRRMQVLEIERERLQQGISSEPIRLHVIFKGNPGTGKTTVARLIGEIYRDLGLLKRGHLKEVARQDLVADHIGGSAIRTNEAIDAALNGVLFIDEAYTLTQGGDSFGQEAVDTLVKRMEDERHRLVVIVAGYPDEMVEFVKSNAGLQRRLMEIVFEDYNPAELLEIFKQRVARVRCSIAPDLELALMNLFGELYERRDRTFGNAGLVENLFNRMDELRSQRAIEQKCDRVLEPFQVADLPAEYRQESRKNEALLQELLQELDRTIGLHSVKKTIREIVDSQIANQRLWEAGMLIGNVVETRHMLFTGNPGTGKTTIARLIGRIFKALGLLRKGQFVEVNREKLVAGYQGQTAPKTKEAIKSALGGILFIDEAYALSRAGAGDNFGKEAIDILVDLIEKDRGSLVVILAGYSREMEQFMDANSGMASRIPYKIEFPDYNGEELNQIFLSMCQGDGWICPPDVSARLQEVFRAAYQNRGRNFGNGRDVRNFYEKMVNRLKSRIVRDNLSGEAMRTFALADIPDGEEGN